MNPYTHLLAQAQKFAHAVKYRRTESGGYFGLQAVKDRVGFRLDDTLVQVETADKLGYDTTLRKTDLGLSIVFVKRPPESPF